MKTITLEFALKLAKSLNKFRTNENETVSETLEYVKTQYNVETPQTTSLPKQKVWIDSSEAYDLGVTVASGVFTGLGGSWFTRKVSAIVNNDLYGKEGVIKINKQLVKVVLDSGNEWRIA